MAVADDAIAEDLDQGADIGAAHNIDRCAGARENLQFPGLLDVTVQQDQEFGWLLLAVPLHEDVARQQRQNLVGRDLLADSGHSQKRP